MTATLHIKKDRPNYFILLRFKAENTGKKVQKWITTDIPVKGNNKRRAEERKDEVLAEYKQNKVDLSKDILFTDFLKEWLEILGPSIKGVTYDGYKLIIYNQIIPFYKPMKLKVRELTPLHIQQYMNFKLKKVSPNTVKKHLWNISKCLDSAVKQKLLAFNPMQGIDMPKQIKFKGAKPYKKEQFDKLLAAFEGDPIEEVVFTTLFFGLRRSEVLGIKETAIDFDSDIFDISHTTVQMGTKIHKEDSTKNESSDSLMPMPNIVANTFKRLIAKKRQNKLLQPNDYIDEGYIFVRPNGQLIPPNYVTKHFKKVLIRNNLPVIRFHDLRHSSAAYLKYLGFDLKDIQIWLRHGDIQTTANIYLDNLNMDTKQGIADRLNEKFTTLEHRRLA
ncbi:MAG: site-specific integrase [Oscillospiraceae bacterium]|nr:site-specific integrase [Oscillospiraceae bacterium]